MATTLSLPQRCTTSRRVAGVAALTTTTTTRTAIGPCRAESWWTTQQQRQGRRREGFSRGMTVRWMSVSEPAPSPPEPVQAAATTTPPPNAEDDWERAPLSRWFDASPYQFPPDMPVQDVYTDVPEGQRIVAVGDVHGDLPALWNFLRTAQVVDPESSSHEPRWTGGSTILVQCGDLLDRGGQEMQCFRLMASLARQAVAQGGAVVMLHGNHEVLNSLGLFQYALEEGQVEMEHAIGMGLDESLGSDRWRLQFAGNQPARWAAFEPGGLLAASTLAHFQVAVVVGRTIFVHAGLQAQHLRDFGGIAGMNQAARNWILKAQHGDNFNSFNYTTVAQVLDSARERARLASQTVPECCSGGIGGNSPIWMRTYSKPNDAPPSDPQAQALMDETLKEVGHGVCRMVMGHTPQDCINAALQGKAWRIDVGASRGVLGGTTEVLEIIHGSTEDQVRILTPRSSTPVPAADRMVPDNVLF